MSIMKSSFSLMVGTVCGTYIAQNYSIPNIKKLVDTAFFMAKHVKEKYRKPKNRGDNWLLPNPIESIGYLFLLSYHNYGKEKKRDHFVGSNTILGFCTRKTNI
ncbi:hypothetical protein PTKIN_Ptkin05aG0223300 [Pterospermum kingtungense]